MYRTPPAAIGALDPAPSFLRQRSAPLLERSAKNHPLDEPMYTVSAYTAAAENSCGSTSVSRSEVTNFQRIDSRSSPSGSGTPARIASPCFLAPAVGLQEASPAARASTTACGAAGLWIMRPLVPR